MQCFRIIVLTFFLLAFQALSVNAKWWIFGQPQEEVSIRYLYLNKISFEESATKIILYHETLEDKMIRIRGKARVKRGKIADVHISVDDKKTWQKAALDQDGAFSYGFTPDINQTYIIYVRVSDFRGKTNLLESTRKEVTFSGDTVVAAVKTVLDAMVDAYKNEDPTRFMSYVSENFTGDDTVLDRAIRRDFSAFDNIDIRIVPGTAAADSRGMIFISVNYNRWVVSAKSGRSFTDRGSTEFVFQPGSVHPLVYGMKNPLLFGLSNAGEVATGTVIPAANDPILIVDDRGNVDVKPFDEAINIIKGERDIDENVESGNNIALISEFHPPAGFDFSDGEVVEGSGDFAVTGYGENPMYAYGFIHNGSVIQDMGMLSLNDVRLAPETGYTNGVNGAVNLYEGHVYAFQLNGPRYAMIYVRSVTVVSGACALNPDEQCFFVRMVMDYKFRGDGMRNF
jgi:hypothetical protein